MVNASKDVRGLPTRIIQTPGQPAVAIFEGNQSFAIGLEVYRLWASKRTAVNVGPKQFADELGTNPVVADLADNQGDRIEGFASAGAPPCAVIRCRDEVRRRFYFDGPWAKALGIKELKAISVADLVAYAPARSIDLVAHLPPKKVWRCRPTVYVHDGVTYQGVECSWQDPE